MIEVLKVNTTAEVVLRASSRLEKATKTTKSNCQPPHHAHSVPHCHISVVLEHPGRVTPHPMGSCASAQQLFGEEIVPNIQPESLSNPCPCHTLNKEALEQKARWSLLTRKVIAHK